MCESWIDDSPRRICAHHPPHAHHRQIRVDRDLREHCAEGMQPDAIPGGDGSVRLHRIVILAGDLVCRVDRYGSGRQCGIGIAPRRVGLDPAARHATCLGHHGRALRSIRPDLGRLGLVGNSQAGSRVFCLIEGLSHDNRHRLAKEVNPLVLQHMQPFAESGVDETAVLAI